MLELITLAVQPFVKIRKEEWPKALLMFFYFFATITCLYILKPVRSSIFLEKSGFENLPYVWISTVFILMAIVAVYVKFAGWVQKNILLIGTVAFFITNILAFWWLLSRNSVPFLPFIFYIWVSIFSIMAVTQFWTLANDIFNPREAKRLFGFIGCGGILGGMLGGYITGLLVHTVGTINLLLVAAFILGFSIFTIHVVWIKEQAHSHSKIQESFEFDSSLSASERKKQDRELFKNIWKSKYLLLLLTMVCLAKLVSTLVEYQFSGIVQNAFQGIDKKTAFFGWFWGTLNTVSFAIQFFLTSRVLRHLGIRVALLILPLGLLFGNMAILLNPGLWSAMFTMMWDGSLNYSLNQASKEVLYLPISREIRYRVKPFIDMVGYRTAKGIGSLLILFLVQVLALKGNYLCLFTLGLIAVWILAAIIMKKEYLGEVRRLLSRERHEAPPIVLQESDMHLVDMLSQNLSPRNENQARLLAVRALNLSHHSGLNQYLKGLSESDFGGARAEVKGYFHDCQGLAEEDFRKKYFSELKRVLRRAGLEYFPEYVGFISSFSRTDSVARLRIHLASRSREVQRASLLLLLQFDPDFDYAKLPETFKKYLKTGSVFMGRVALNGGMIETHSGREESRKISLIRKKLIRYLEKESGEKAFGLIQEYLLDEGEFMSILDEFLNKQRLPDFASADLVKLLGMIPRQKSVEILQKTLLHAQGDLRNLILEALSKVRVENPTLNFNENVLLKEIHAEGREYGKVLRLASIYLWREQKSFSQCLVEQDLFMKAQENRLNEIVQRLFLLLILLSEPEDIRAAYGGFSHKSDYVRATALELLDNVLVPRLRKPILSILDGEESLPHIREKGMKDFHWNEERAKAYLKKACQSHDLWSSLSSVVLMIRCHLKELVEDCVTNGHYQNQLVHDTLLLAQEHGIKV